MDLLATNPQSKNLQETYVNATGIEKKRSAKSAKIEGSIKKWDESADMLNQVELWCQKKENFDEFDDDLERRGAELRATIAEAVKHLATCGDLENETLLSRVRAISERSGIDADEIENMINLTESIKTELDSITADLDAYQAEFNQIVKNISTAPCSALRHEKFERLQGRLQSLQSPLAQLEVSI